MNKYLEILKEKGKNNAGYQSDEDRLIYFYNHADIMNISPERAALDLSIKHFISVKAMVDDIENNVPDEEYADEKIGDLINYLLFIRALIHVRKMLNDNTKKGLQKITEIKYESDDI